MRKHDIRERIGSNYYTTNLETDEYSYAQEAGSKEKLFDLLGYTTSHIFADIRFECNDVVVLVETKQNFVNTDALQLKDYVNEEKAVHPDKKIIAILANTQNDDIRVWKSIVDDEHLLAEETIIRPMADYVRMFDVITQNDRETVLKNTYALNDLLHKKDIDENKRSQFVGTSLLYIKQKVKDLGIATVDENTRKQLRDSLSFMSPAEFRGGIEGTLNKLLDGSENKQKKVELLQKNVINDQKVRKLEKEDWIQILDFIFFNIYRYINADSSEGQDILNMFFIAFNKYTGKADKNQAFTPDHITEFMCRITNVDRTKVVLDATCGSGSFLVQAMAKEIADCRKGRTDEEAAVLIEQVKKEHIFGIENEEKAFGLATTNMLIHGDGNSNVIMKNCFECEDFIKKANPDIILMNPPYNAKPKTIPSKYKDSWGKSKDGKEDPTKGFVFIQFLSDVIKKMNKERELQGKQKKMLKLAVLLPVSVAIGTSTIIQECKKAMLKDNRLDAVFTLPNEIFYPGASASACCMVFTLGKSHVSNDGFIEETFFGYYKDDGFKKKKNLGRVEQFDIEGKSKWKAIEEKWIKAFRNKTVIDGLSATAEVSGKDEWLCEAYMKTDYSRLCENDFQNTLNNYLAYLIKEDKLHES